MTATVWTVYVDSDDDGSFESGENLSAFVREMEWKLGFPAYEFLERDAYAKVTLNNHDGSLSPETSTYNLIPGRRLRIQAYDGVITRTMFMGYIRSVEAPEDNTVILHAITMLSAALGQPVSITPQVNTTADAVIQAILDKMEFRQPYLGTIMILDYGVLDTNTLADAPLNVAGISLGAGVYTFDYVGDTWAAGVTARQALQEVLEVEAGYLWTNGAGQLIFRARDYFYTGFTPDSTLHNLWKRAEYGYGDQMVNIVEIVWRPRGLGAAQSVLWTSTVAHGVDGRAIKEFRVAFRDSSGNPIGAYSVTTPPNAGEFVFYDGGGNDVTASVRVNLTSEASRAMVRVENTRGSAVYLQPGAMVRGTPLVQGDDVVVLKRDEISVTRHGPRPYPQGPRRVPLLNNLDDAEQLAGYELLRRGLPIGEVQSVTLDGRDTFQEANALARTMLDMVTVRDTRLGHDNGYIVVGLFHQVVGGVHMVRWDLEPASNRRVIHLDFYVLDDVNFRLGY